eukprot:53469-Amphidinium_carterae.1
MAIKLITIWHHLQSGSGSCAQYGHDGLQADGGQSKQLLADGFFKPDHSHSSLPNATIDELIGPSPAFPTHTPAEHKLASLHALCVHHYEGSRTKMQDSCDEVGQHRVHLVVKSCPYGSLVIDGRHDKVEQRVPELSFTVHNPVRTSNGQKERIEYKADDGGVKKSAAMRLACLSQDRPELAFGVRKRHASSYSATLGLVWICHHQRWLRSVTAFSNSDWRTRRSTLSQYKWISILAWYSPSFGRCLVQHRYRCACRVAKLSGTGV